MGRVARPALKTAPGRQGLHPRGGPLGQRGSVLWQHGSVLLDLLIALLIASTAVLLLTGGVSLAARTARSVRERAVRQIEERSREAESRPEVFVNAPAGTGDQPPAP